MQVRLLSEVSEVIAGYTFRGALEPELNGNTRVVLAKNINEDGTVNYEVLPRICMSSTRTAAFVNQGDVLLSCRGIFRSGVSNKKSENMIASSSVFILRLIGESLIPEFLSIYLNSEVGQSNIQKIITGTTIKTVLRKDLETLPICVPTLEDQMRIVEIDTNWKKRQQLLNQKMYLSKNIAEGAIKKLLTT